MEPTSGWTKADLAPKFQWMVDTEQDVDGLGLFGHRIDMASAQSFVPNPEQTVTIQEP